MRLNNSFKVIAKTEKGKDFLKSFFPPDMEDIYSGGWELTYFRKCWNVRNRFIERFNYDYDKQEIVFILKDIPKVIKTFKYFLNERNWKGNGGSIWSWYQAISWIADGIHYFEYLGRMAENQGITDEDIKIWLENSY